MKLDKQYIQHSFFDMSYLFPIGQHIADFRNGLTLNESSSFLLELLEKDMDFDSIYKAFIDRYSVAEEEREGLRQDLAEVISQLCAKGYIIDDDGGIIIPDCSKAFFFKLGSLSIKICGARELIHHSFWKFAVDDGRKCDQTIFLLRGEPEEHINGRVLIRNREVIIMESYEQYIFLFPGHMEINELHVEKSGQKVLCYYSGSVRENLEQVREDIFHALRFAFLILAQNNEMYVLHSASLLYKDKVWLFSGCSGTGKSTHTNLWKKQYSTPVLNGDLNMIGFMDGKPYVFGIPWCGTSEIFTEKAYPLGGITFLKQAAEDKVEFPDKAQSAVLFLQRIISPMWTEELFGKSAAFAEKLVENTKVFRLYCTKNVSAAAVMKQAIDDKKL